MNLHEIDRRLVMRYESGRSFSFNHLVNGADNGKVYGLAQAFASIQSDQPTRISTVVTRRVM